MKSSQRLAPLQDPLCWPPGFRRANGFLEPAAGVISNTRTITSAVSMARRVRATPSVSVQGGSSVPRRPAVSRDANHEIPAQAGDFFTPVIPRVVPGIVADNRAWSNPKQAG